MCELCEIEKEEEKLITEGSWINMYIRRSYFDEYSIIAKSDGRASFEINYCPECGKELI